MTQESVNYSDAPAKCRIPKKHYALRAEMC